MDESRTSVERQPPSRQGPAELPDPRPGPGRQTSGRRSWPPGCVRGDWNLPADRIDLPYVADPDLDLPLTRSARPVLRQLHENLDGQPISVILTDRTGLVLRRLTADSELSRHLDKVHLAPGFSYAEEFAGTNGIGTALEGGGPMHVFGHEHYAEDLGGPRLRRRTDPAPDHRQDRRRDRPDLLAQGRRLAADRAGQDHRGPDPGGTAERQLGPGAELLQAYLQAGRRLGDMVLAVDDDLLLMNARPGRSSTPPISALCSAHAAEMLAAGRHRRRRWSSCRPGAGSGSPAGRCPRWTRSVPGSSRSAAQTAGSDGGRSCRATGRRRARCCPAWSAAARPGSAAAARSTTRTAPGSGCVLSGERGVGKVALARAAHQQNNPAGSFHVVDAARRGAMASAAELEAELADDSVQALVIRHVERLDAARLDETGRAPCTAAASAGRPIRRGSRSR